MAASTCSIDNALPDQPCADYHSYCETDAGSIEVTSNELTLIDKVPTVDDTLPFFKKFSGPEYQQITAYNNWYHELRESIPDSLSPSSVEFPPGQHMFSEEEVALLDNLHDSYDDPWNQFAHYMRQQHTCNDTADDTSSITSEQCREIVKSTFSHK